VGRNTYFDYEGLLGEIPNFWDAEFDEKDWELEVIRAGVGKSLYTTILSPI
jgi:hypothetical protein